MDFGYSFTLLLTLVLMGPSVTPEEFVARLDEVSKYNGTPYGRAHFLFDEEANYGQKVLQFKGYLSLSDAFKCCFLETVELINTDIRPRVLNPLSEHFPLFLARLTLAFHSLCGAERAALQGYPYIGYTSLRNIFDNLVLTTAAIQKLTDFYAIEGVIPGGAFEPEAARKLRKATEFAVRTQLTGQQSNLPPDVIAELAVWDALFDYETHGARLSLADAMDWMKGVAPLPALPKFKQPAFAMFMNRFVEIAWMAHRLIPLVQPPGINLPAAWAEKWDVVDDSFRIMANSLTEQLGKPIGKVMSTFVDAKFPFNAKSSFTL